MASTQIKPYVNKKSQRNSPAPLFTNYGNQARDEAKTQRTKTRSPFPASAAREFQTDFVITDIQLLNSARLVEECPSPLHLDLQQEP